MFYVRQLFSEKRAVKKYGGARQAKDDNTAHALCIPDNKG
jgi:hypothetical protein